MNVRNSSTPPVNSDLKAPASPENRPSTADSPPHQIIPAESLCWRIFRWPVSLFCCSWVRVRVQGLEHIDHRRGGLFLMNHQSFLDPLLAAVRLNRPVSYLARDNLFRIPIIGWILRHTHVIPISREAARSGSIRAAIEQLESGFLVGIFPEGTRATGDQVSRFRPGFIAIARRTNQPIYPVGIAGANRVMPRGAWFIRPGRVQIVYGAPLTDDEVQQFQTAKDDKALCELAHARVSECAAIAASLLTEQRNTDD